MAGSEFQYQMEQDMEREMHKDKETNLVLWGMGIIAFAILLILIV